jgi:hypothetical protein
MAAEIQARWALELAFPAFHGFPRRIVERGSLEESSGCAETQRDGMNSNCGTPQ